eukprot:TRINITY_DN123358_c0_g1_i1.p1 TRINITY_DN123358_c0_g1~~TRINITY_DN123358_c0_g1_i1.p1  ORF type:complete len:354 (-),score=77.88 TRINITY_DN123358_c0_g1_i1:47-1108(-)
MADNGGEGVKDMVLVDVLIQLGLLDLEEKLAQLGVETISDLAVLGDDDLIGIGMTLVQIRKLGRLVQANCRRNGRDSILQNKLARSESHQKRLQSLFWQGQCNRPMRLVFIRHGESEANVDRAITEVVPDHRLHLTAQGRKQALDAGARLRSITGDGSVKFIVSPYTRTKETLNGILQAYKDRACPVREDVRIREQEYGNFERGLNMKALHKEKREYGAFYYRFPEGESPADCYERASVFFETMYRSWEDNEHENEVIVCHGLMIVVTLMKFMRLDIEEYETIDALKNCEFVVLERPPDDGKYTVSFTWASGSDKDYQGLRRKAVEYHIEPVWSGDPEEPLLESSRLGSPVST